MDMYQDYLAFKKEPIMVMLKERESLLYERFEPVIKVLDYCVELYNSDPKLEESFFDVFKTGFDYLYNMHIEVSYFYDYINKNDAIFNKYELLYNYLLQINVLECRVNKVEFDKVVSEIANEINHIITNNMSYSVTFLDECNQKLDAFEYNSDYSIEQIFVLLAEKF